MIYVFLGSPASGKDTQISRIQEVIKLPNISTGQICRDAIASGTEFGNKVAEIYNSGQWLPDDMIYSMLKERVSQPDCAKGFIINGFPRRVTQIPLLDKLAVEMNQKIEKVVHFDLDRENVMKRMETQRLDSPERTDLSPEAVEKRYNQHVENVEPILKEYEKLGILIRIDARPSKDEVFAATRQALGL